MSIKCGRCGQDLQHGAILLVDDTEKDQFEPGCYLAIHAGCIQDNDVVNIDEAEDGVLTDAEIEHYVAGPQAGDL